MTFDSAHLHQMNCLIYLPDRSGNFLAFWDIIARNTVKSEKTGFGLAITARPRPVILRFQGKILRTFYFTLTEQSCRKKLAVGGFESSNARTQGRKEHKLRKIDTVMQQFFIYREKYLHFRSKHGII